MWGGPMARPALEPGAWGELHVKAVGDRFRARAYFRYRNGQYGEATRSGRSKAAARTALLAHLKAVTDTGTAGKLTSSSTVDDLVTAWLTAAEDEGSRRPQTMRAYRRAAVLHVSPACGALRIREATVGALDDALRSIGGDGARKTAKAVLSQAFGYAARLGIVAANPVRDTSNTRRSGPVRRRVPTDLEVAEYRQAVAGWCGSNSMGPARGDGLLELVDVIAGTGLRIGEALALRHRDVDLTEGTITVVGTVVGGEWQEMTKTTAGHRRVSVPSWTVEVLARQMAHSVGVLTGLVWPSARGTVRTVPNVERQLRQARPDHLSWFTPHALRRRVATAVDAALGVEAAAAHLGHSGVAVTEAHYVQRVGAGPAAAAVLEGLRPAVGESNIGSKQGIEAGRPSLRVVPHPD